jgi:myo-inositol 2-dehydrogenase/D-chiro-inositol 1-dehydrogenase
MKPTTVGVIGAGRIGRMHVQNLVHSVPEAFVKVVASRSIDASWADELGVPLAVRDFEVILGDPEIEAVAIALSSDLHVEAICRAARAGKHIFCEKPVAFSPGPIREALAAVQEAGVQLQVGFNRRFDPSLLKLQQAVRDGAVGELQGLRIINRDPQAPDIEFVQRSGGLFFDFTIHDFDTVRFLSGMEISEVHAIGTTLVDPEIGAAGDIDTAVIAIRLANGALGSIDNSRESGYGYDQRFEAFGAQGNLAVDNVRPTTLSSSLESGVFVDGPASPFVERYREAFIAELRAFVRSVRSGEPVAATGEDALAAIQAAQAATLSRRENRPVELAEIDQQVSVGVSS